MYYPIGISISSLHRESANSDNTQCTKGNINIISVHVNVYMYMYVLCHVSI